MKDENGMLVKLNQLDVAENLTKSLSLDSQKDIKVICWGWIAFSGKEKLYLWWQREETSGNATIALL